MTCRKTATTTRQRTLKARWRRRIRQLEAILNDAEVVEGGGPADEVAAGVTVRLRYVGDDEVERYLIGSIEEREQVPLSFLQAPPSVKR